MSKQKWETVDDMIEALRDIHDRLEDGDIKVDEAQAKTRTIGHALKWAALAHEHAVESERIKPGEDTIAPLNIRRVTKGKKEAA